MLGMLWAAAAAPLAPSSSERRSDRTEAACSIVPVPARARRVGGPLAVPRRCRILLGEQAAPVERYAAERLSVLLGAWLGMRAEIAQLPQQRARDGLEILLGTAASNSMVKTLSAGRALRASRPDANLEGYSIRVILEGKRTTLLVAGGGPAGALYGAMTAWQMFHRDGKQLLLERLSVDDEPAVPVRAMYIIPGRLGLGWSGGPRGQVAKIPADKLLQPRSVWQYYLDWLAEHRVNLICYETCRGVPVPPGLKEMVAEAHRRGIRFFGNIRYVGNWDPNSYICASDPAQVSEVLGYCRAYLDAGCDGLAYLADDISPAFLGGHCERCKKQFGGLAGEQAFLLRKMVELAQSSGVQPEDVYFCPTYYHAYDGTHRDYFLTFSSDPLLRRVPFFMTFYDPEQIQRFEKDTGLKYIWWYNGPRSLSYFYRRGEKYTGIEAMYYPLEFGWHGLKWERGKGFVLPSPDVEKRFAEMAPYSRVFWMCCGGDTRITHAEYAHAMWGIYSWNPRAFNQAEAETAVLARLMGVRAAAQVQRLNQACLQIAAMQDRPSRPSGADLQVPLRQAREALERARRCYDRHRKAVGDPLYGDSGAQFVINTLDRYGKALDAVQSAIER